MKRCIKRLMIFAITFCMLVSMNVIVHAAPDTNLALNKNATACEVENGTSFTANLAVDGNGSTRWASNPDYNLVKGVKWLQVDFGSVTTFDLVEVQWEQQNILDFTIQVSNDASSWVNVGSRQGTPNSKMDSIELATPAIGRYIRICANDYNGDWPSVSIFELSVYNTKDTGPVETTGNYQIYPTVQKVTDFEATITLSNEINVIVEENIDKVTLDRINEVLSEHNLTANYSSSRVEGKTNLYVGINGSKQLADNHNDVPREVFEPGENKYDMYVLKVFNNNDIVILGKDSDGAFYALATLEQMLDQISNNELKVSVFEDYAFQKYRGAVEGYYGYPWSVEGTLSWFDYAKRYKMNVFLYGPKSDPYHLGKWDEEYPTSVSDEDHINGVRTQDEMEQYASKATACNVDFIWVAHPAMQKPIDFTNETTIEEGLNRLMNKFDQMYNLGVRQFGIFVDDISNAQAASTCDMQIYMLNQIEERLYAKYNGTGSSSENNVKPLFFTPAWYTTSSSGASTYLPRFKNVKEDIEICFTGSDVFSSISNNSATTFKNMLGRTPVMWWNYPVNDAEDSVYFTNPINFDYSQDSNPTNLKGVLANPMNFSEASKVAFFGLADYTWNPQQFDAKKNWDNCFDAIIPDDTEMAKALKVVYGNLNDDYVPNDLKRAIANYNSNDRSSVLKLKAITDEIMMSISKIESLKDSSNQVYRLIVSEAQTSLNKLYDMAQAISGALAIKASDDPVEQVHGYYQAVEANERLSIVRNERYKIVSLEGAGEDIYNSVLQAIPSDKGLKPFVSIAMDNLSGFDPNSKDTSSAVINSITINPKDNVVVKQGASCNFTAIVKANRNDVNDVIYSVSNASSENTIISANGVLTVDKNELSPTINVVATSPYDKTKSTSVIVTIADKQYVDPTIATNLGPSAVILGASGNPAKAEGPENVFDDSDTTKWCPGGGTTYNQWLAFDLGSTKLISAWQLVGGGIEHPTYAPSAFSLQVLKDPNPSNENLANTSYLSNNDNWQDVSNYTNNTDNIINAKFDQAITGRYFRLFIANAVQAGAPYPATRIFETRIFGVDKQILDNTHKLSLINGINHGTIAIESSNYEAGAKVNLVITPEEGYQLKANSLKFNDTVIEGTSFIMPNQDTVISAIFEPIGQVSTFDIIIDKVNNGVISADVSKASSGDTVILTITPNKGYELKEGSLKVNGQVIKGNIFIMPNSKASITGEFVKIEVSESVNKEALAIAVLKANEITDLDNVVPVVVKEFNEALKQATTILNDDKYSQEEVDQAFDRLSSAMQKLSFIKGDKTQLQSMYDKVMALDEQAYIPSTYTTLKAMLPEVKELLKDENALEKEVNEMHDSLTRAFLDLRLKPNKDLLKGLIEKANALNEKEYDVTSWKVLKEAVSKANKVYKDNEATNEMVSDVESMLTRAIEGLVKVETEKPDNKPTTNNPTITKPTSNKTTSVKTGDEVIFVSFIILSFTSLLVAKLSKKRKND